MQQQKLHPKTASHTPNLQALDSMQPKLISEKISPSCSPTHILSLNDVFVPLESVQPGN